MDIDQARTFLAIVTHGSFASAGEHLHLTQTAVSARIRTLEDQLDTRLFVRDKSGARMTAAGERFVRYATALVKVWDDARHQVALSAGRAHFVGIGGEPSVWNPLLTDWLLWMHDNCQDVSVRVDIETAGRLLERVQDGTLDLAVVYGPPERRNLVVELLSEEKLVMVTTDGTGAWKADRYIHIDWGPAFNASCRAAFPDLGGPVVSTSHGPLGLLHVQAVGGCGYFRSSAVQGLIDSGILFRVPDAPQFSHSVYAVYPPSTGSATWSRVLEGLRGCSRRAG